MEVLPAPPQRLGHGGDQGTVLEVGVAGGGGNVGVAEDLLDGLEAVAFL